MDELIHIKQLHSPEAEKAVLGCMLAQPNEVMDDCLTLKTTDFFDPAHSLIFSTVKSLHGSKHPIDVIEVYNALGKKAESVGGLGTLAELLSGFANHLNITSYIRIVREKSLLRSLNKACVDIVRDIHEMPDSVASVLDRAESALGAISNSCSPGYLLSASECVEEYSAWRESVQSGKVEPRLKTGLMALDQTNGGLPVPSYVVIAGEQGMGKSALILNIMKNACLAGMPVGGFSMEMTVNQIISRLVSDLGDINSRRLNGKLHPDEEATAAAALEKIRRMPFFIERRSGLMPNDLRVMSRQMVRQGCKMIWLDNAQLMQGSSNKDQRVQQLTEVSRTIQHLQKEHNIVFILLAQVTRDAQKRGNMKAFDLADCAAFERDARVVVMLERMPTSDAAPIYAVPITARIAKYSEGETGDMQITFNKTKQRIT